MHVDFMQNIPIEKFFYIHFVLSTFHATVFTCGIQLCFAITYFFYSSKIFCLGKLKMGRHYCI